jgi:hypothetical protein
MLLNNRSRWLTGDSITAGFAMQDLPLEYRGTVYSAGGTLYMWFDLSLRHLSQLLR